MSTSSLFGKFDVIVWLRRLTLGLLSLVTAFSLIIWITTKSPVASEAMEADEGILGAIGALLSALTEQDDPSAAIGVLWSLFLMSLLPVAVIAYFAAVPLLCVRLAFAAHVERNTPHFPIATVGVFLLGAGAFYFLCGSRRLWTIVRGEDSLPIPAGFDGFVANGVLVGASIIFGVVCACCVRSVISFKLSAKLGEESLPTPERAALRASLIEQPILPVLVVFQAAFIGSMILAPAPAFLVVLLWLLPCSVLWLLVASRLTWHLRERAEN